MRELPFPLNGPIVLAESASALPSAHPIERGMLLSPAAFEELNEHAKSKDHQHSDCDERKQKVRVVHPFRSRPVRSGQRHESYRHG